MSILDTADDFLIHRVYQSLTDLAATFDVKAKHLSASCYVLAGASTVLQFGPKAVPLTALLCCAGSAYAIIIRPVPLPKTWRFPLTLGSLASCLTAIVNYGLLAALFGAFYFSALYFSTCRDKPPKHRWWKELKKAVEALAWTPELGVRAK
jgi:hypothetical protein